jgi:hypothetical protein
MKYSFRMGSGAVIHIPSFIMMVSGARKVLGKKKCTDKYVHRKLNSVALVRERPLRPRDRRLSAKLVPMFADKGCRVVSATDPHGSILGFLDRSRYYFFQVAPQLYSQG